MSAAASPFWVQLDAESRSQFWATLALRHAQGLGPRTWTRLLKSFGSAYGAMQHLPEWSALGVGADKCAQVAAGSWRTTAREEWDAAQASDSCIVMWHDPLYPALLRELPDAPALLYCQGDLSLLQSPAVAVVGSRLCTDEGLRVAANIARRLSACGITIVSGMALGIDTAAHSLALQEVGKSIAVLGAGMDRVYPRSNAGLRERMGREGLVISEFAPSTPPLAGNFPVRNRIISGLSLGVLVVEAALRSGSLITARLALEQNREVYAVPGSVFAERSHGCQELIRQGAHAAFGAEDIVRDLSAQLATYGIQRDTLPPLENADIPEFVAEARAPGQKSSPKIPSQKSLKAPKATGVAENTGAAAPQRLPQAVQSPLPEGDAGRILAHIRQYGTCHVDVFCEELDMQPGPLNSLLVELEVAQRIQRLPGAFYCENIPAVS